MDHRLREAWIAARRKATEQVVKFGLSLRKKHEVGEIVQAHGDGTYDVQVVPPTHYSRLRSTDPSARWHKGDRVTLVYSYNSIWMPQILADHGGKRKGGYNDGMDSGADPSIWLRGLWPQAEGSPELAQDNLQATSPPNWLGISNFALQFTTPAPPNASYLARGFVFWQEAQGNVGFAFSHWAQNTDSSWSLAITLGVLYGPNETVSLGSYAIANNNQLISQGGATYDGGTDHGGLALHYLRSARSLLLFGPLTHPDGRMHAYCLNNATGTITRTDLNKLPIHASVGHRDVLLGWWGGNASPSYYSSTYAQLYRLTDGLLVTRAVVGRNQLTDGDYYYGCHPNGTRARGRWPWRPTVVGEEVREGEFGVAAVSAVQGTVSMGSGETLDGFPDPVEDVDIYTQQRVDFSLVSASGGVDRIYTNLVNNVDTTNTDSLDWYAARVAYPDGAGGEVQQLGWAEQGQVRTKVTVPVSAEFPTGNRIVRGPTLHTADAQHLLHPMLERNDLSWTDGNDVFEWRPGPTEHQPIGSFSKSGYWAKVYSEPQFEIYGSSDFSPFFDYANPAWAEWLIEYNEWLEIEDNPNPPPVEPAQRIEEQWRIPRKRRYYRTYLDIHNEVNGPFARVDISQELEGLVDGPLSVVTEVEGEPVVELQSRAYEGRPLLDQVWQYRVIDGLDSVLRTELHSVPILRDWRSQDDDGPSEARPVLQLRELSSEAPQVLLQELVPTTRYSTGSSRYAKCMAGRPFFKSGLDESGYPWIDVFTQFRTRASEDDDEGDESTHVLRITQLRWDDTHSTLASPSVGTLDFAGLILTEQSLEGLAYVPGGPILQAGTDAYAFS